MLRQKKFATIAFICLLATQSVHAGDIVDTAVGAGNFETLVTAVKAAGLVETLKGDGPFTVFAPTDEAFGKLPAETIQSLLKPEGRAQLTSILTYHVVPGRILAKDVVELDAAETVEGSDIGIRTEDGKVFINDSQVVATDIECDNGVIHVIDAVLIPTADDSGEEAAANAGGNDIVETAVAAGGFETLVAAVKAAGLVDTLKGEGPFTVFAPTDDAFAKLPAGAIDSLLKPENKGQLIEILTYHVVPGRVLAADVVNLSSAKTVQGGAVRIDAAHGVKINDAKVVATDIECSNGVIHVIDSILMPPKKMTSYAAMRKKIEHAISRGVPAFNGGHHCQCAHYYNSVCSELVMDHGDDLPENVRNDLRETLKQCRHMDSATDRAWALRRAMDRSHQAMH